MCETVEVCVWLDNIGADDQTECLIGNIDMWECDARNTVRQYTVHLCSTLKILSLSFMFSTFRVSLFSQAGTC